MIGISGQLLQAVTPAGKLPKRGMVRGLNRPGTRSFENMTHKNWLWTRYALPAALTMLSLIHI